MLQLYNKNKNKIAGLIEYKDLSIESILNTGDKTLTFTYHKAAKFYEDIEEEAYIQTKTDEFVIKAKEVQDDETTFTCTLNVEYLEGHIIDRFESKEQTIESALNLALVNTGWIIENCDIKRKRTVRMSNSSSWDIIQEIKKTYRVEIQFDTLNKKINVYEHIGSDKGTYFIDSLNLTALSIQSNSYDFATRIIPVGKNGLTIESINNGKNYIENYQYSNKVKTIYWKDERYTIAEDLKEDAEAKLNEISKPYRAYSASIINLAQINDKYKNILDYKLGDTITLISKDAKIRERQRIVKIKEYPNDHSRDTVELANTVLTFEDIQKQFKDTSDIVDNITSDNGTVDGSTIDSIKVNQIEDFKANVIEVTNLEALNANISNLHANKADIQELNAVRSDIGTLNATKADITELNSVKASLKKLQADKADVTTLNAAVERVGILEGKTISVENQLSGNLTAKNFKANSITAESGIIAEGAIGSAQISSLSVNKLEAGEFITSKHKIVSEDGTIEIVGNQILINRNNINRVVLGEYRKQDNTTDYGLLIRSKDGKTIMLDGEGVHNAGITDGAINNNKVADNANIAGNKLDINSVIREVNGANETIKGTRVQVGDRTLDVELSTQKNTITENSKELSNQKATIQALDNAIKLKVDNQTFTQSTATINSNINNINSDLIGKINASLNNAKSYADNSANNAKRSAISSANNYTNTAKTDAIKQANSNTIDAINKIEIGGRNLIENSNTTYLDNLGVYNPSSDIVCSFNEGWSRITFTNQLIGKEIVQDKWIDIDKLGYYTFSIECKSDACSLSTNISWFTNEDGHRIIDATIIKLKDGLFKIVSTYNITKLNRLRVVDLIGFTTVGATYLEFGLPKLEFGTKATDWTQAPEDLKKYSDDVAKAKADLAQITAQSYADGKVTEEEQKRVNEAKKNLDTAISKANEAESKAKSYADAKKQEAINSASSYATNKVNNALNNAKSYTDAQITTTNSNVSKATSEINILKEQISTKVGQVDIDRTVNNIEIGGRNLWINTGFTDGTRGFASYQATNVAIIDDSSSKSGKALKFNSTGGGIYQRYKLGEGTPFNNGEKLVISGYFKCSSTAHLNVRLEGVSYGVDFTPKTANEWTRFELSVVANGTAHTFTLYGVNGNTYTVKEIKLEKGNKATDWTPAPEDTDQTIVDNIKVVTDKINDVSTKLSQTKDSIVASVNSLNSTTQTITTNLTNATNDLNNKINAASSHADSIAESKSNEALNNAKTYTNAQITTVNTRISNTESSINVLKNQISTKVSQSDIDKSIQNIKIGGRNLALGTANPISLSNFNGSTNYCSNPYKVIHIQDCKEGDILTISYDLEYTNLSRQANGTFYLHGWGDITGWSGSANIIDNPSMDRIIWNSKDKEILKVVSYMKVNTTTLKDTSVNLRIRTDYLTGGSFTIKNFKVEKSKNISDWTVAPEDVNQAITDNIQTVTTKINNVESTLTQKTDNINAAVTSVQSILKTKADGSTVSSMQSQLSSLNLGLDGIKTEVSKKTDKSSIISAINQSAEKIKIDASKIELNGITTFSDNGIKAVEVKNNSVRLFNWNKNGEFIGMLTSAVLDKDNSKPIMNLVNRKNSAAAIGYTENDVNFSNYITFDKFGVVGNTVPIGLNEDVSLKGSVMYFADSKKNSIFENTNEKIIVKGKHGLAIIDTDSGNTTAALDSDRVGFSKWNQRFYYAEFFPNAFSLGDGSGKSFMWKNSNSDIVCVRNQLRVVSNNGNNFLMDVDSNSFEMADSRYNKPYLHFGSNNFEFYDATNGFSCFWKKGNEKKIWTGKGIALGVQGDLTVSGKKNRVVETSYGNLTLNAVESAECWFTDMLIDQSKTDCDGNCIIWFDNKFLQTVNTRYKYKIDVTPLGEFASNGKLTYIRVVEKTEKYFKVRGTPDTLFDWTITAKQKGYEKDRLEKTS